MNGTSQLHGAQSTNKFEIIVRDVISQLNRHCTQEWPCFACLHSSMRISGFLNSNLKSHVVASKVFPLGVLSVQGLLLQLAVWLLHGQLLWSMCPCPRLLIGSAPRPLPRKTHSFCFSAPIHDSVQDTNSGLYATFLRNVYFPFFRDW